VAVIVLVLVVVAGLLLVGVAIDALRARADGVEHARYERARHAALMREVRRQP
jgi:hypothetical protein